MYIFIYISILNSFRCFIQIKATAQLKIEPNYNSFASLFSASDLVHWRARRLQNTFHTSLSSYPGLPSYPVLSDRIICPEVEDSPNNQIHG